MRKKLVAGNWKMHGALRENEALLGDLCEGVGAISSEVMVCPPYPYLSQVAARVAASGVLLGAQDVSPHSKGAYTGEVSAAMLRDVGCTHVIVGHSERRMLHGESDALVAEKFSAASDAGLVPVLCVGETLAERERGDAEIVVVRQISAVLDRVGVAALRGALIAYEPVWAIGTGVTASPEQAQAMHAAIRACVARISQAVAEEVRILYGGSVKPENAAQLFCQPDIDGALVGGASLISGDFLAICRVAV